MVCRRDFVLVALQFLEEENLKETAHKLEQESGVFFNMTYFESLVTNGDWDEVEKYLSGFAKVEDDEHSEKIFLEIRKQKYLEALDRQDRAKAQDILAKELKVVCSNKNEDLFKEMTQLLNLDNIRENENLAQCGDTESERVRTFSEVKKAIEANPVIRDKLLFPISIKSRLNTLIHQSLKLQHSRCEYPRPNPDIKTLIVDHDCGPPSAVNKPLKVSFVLKPKAHGHGAHGPAPRPLKRPRIPLRKGVTTVLVPRPLKRPKTPPRKGATTVLDPPPLKRPRTPRRKGVKIVLAAAPLKRFKTPPNKGASVDCQSNDDLERALKMSMETLLAAPPNNGASVDCHLNDDLERALKMSMETLPALAPLKRPRTPPIKGASVDYDSDDDVELAFTRSALLVPAIEERNRFLKDHAESSYSSNDLPINAVMQLPQGSAVKSMDFHPLQPVLLLVGTNIGDVMVWELVTRKVVFAKFKVWVQCSVPIKSASINRVMWSPDGTLFGVAYSMHLVHLFSYTDSSDFCELRNPLEIEAHAGSVNDLAFSIPTEQLCLVTCGEDMMIKVWDATTGNKQRTLKAHETPIYSVCPNHTAVTKFFFSTTTDGEITQWVYDDDFLIENFRAPYPSSTTMAYSDDESRLFSCGTNLEGVSYLAEWNEDCCEVKRNYQGLEKHSVGVIQFDTTKNKFLAAGHDFMVKYWDMNEETPLTITDAEGGLAASPCVRFNNNGTLLAVSTCQNGVQVLASDDGLRWLGRLEFVTPPAVGKLTFHEKSDKTV